MGEISAPALIGAGAASSVAGTLTSWLTGRSSQEHAANLQFDNWKKMFDYEAAYNSPVNQLRRASKAGVNPFVSPTGSQMLQMASAHGTPNASIPVAFGSEGFGTSFSQIMQGLLAAQAAEGKGIENKKLASVLDSQIQANWARAGYEQSLADFQKMENEVYSEFGRKKARNEVRKLYGEIAKQSSEIFLNEQLSEKAAAERLESLTRFAHEQAKAALTQKELDVFDQKFDIWKNLTMSQIQANKASAYESYKTGEFHAEQAQTEKEIRSFRKDAMTLENGLKAVAFNNENKYSDSERAVALDAAISTAEIKDKENKLYYARFAIEVFNAVVNGIFDVAFAKGMLKKAAQASKSAEAGKAAEACR